MARPSGMAIKIFWRWHNGVAHGFSRGNVGYVALCGRYVILGRGTTVNEQQRNTRLGGQKKYRPPAIMRCAVCDNREAKRHGVDESVDESPNWQAGENLNVEVRAANG